MPDGCAIDGKWLSFILQRLKKNIFHSVDTVLFGIYPFHTIYVHVFVIKKDNESV